MAEIKQTLGFEVTEAMTALGQLDKKLQDLEKGLNSAAKAVENFNQAGASTGAGKGATANLSDYISKLQELYQVSGTASVQQQRSFQSAITSAAEFAQKHNISVGQVITQSQNLGKSYTGTANILADRLAAIDRASKEHLNAAGNRINGLKVTWETMSRVVMTQLLVRAMSMLRNALEESITAAINFETRLAEIQTIGGPAAGSLQLLSIQMRGLSEEFAKPVEDVAEGYYQILSNQIGNAADSFVVARESARLATAAVSSFADAANALSSVINSYKMHASDAADISGKLFATVEMGRLRLSDIANTLGRVTVLAHEVGVSLDEVFASLATLTISGVKPDEAMTLLSNAMRGLLKPTKDMSKAFEELGFVNAETGIAAYGFQGFLEKLRGTTNGTASEIAKLTQNIRVGRGVIGLTGEATQTYIKNLEKIRGAGAETAEAKSKLILETNAQQVQREFTELRNFFVNDFGVAALKVIKETLDYFGGLVNVVRSLKASLIWVGGTILLFKLFSGTVNGLVYAFTAQKTAMELCAMTANRLKAALLSIPGLIAFVALTAGAVALYRAMNEGKQSAQEYSAQLDETFNAMRDRNNELAAAQTIDAKKVAAARTKTVEEAYAKQLKLTADLQKLYNQDAENAKDAQKTILANLKDQLRERLSAITKLIHELERKQDESKRVIDKNREETASLKLTDQERYVDRQIGRLGDEQKAVLQLKRARELEYDATKLSQASDFKGSEELLKTADQRANAALELGEARLKEAKTTEEQQAALTAISAAEREISSILQQRLALREAENKAARAQAEAAQQEIDARRAQLRDAKALVAQIEKYEVLGKEKQTPEERAKARETVLSLTQQLEQVLSQGNINLEEFLGIQELTRKIRGDFESAITDRPVSLTFAFSEGIDAILAPLEAHRVKFQAMITDLETVSGAKFDLTSGYPEIQIKLTSKKDELVKAINDLSEMPTLKGNLSTQQDRIKTLAFQLFNDKNLTQGAVEKITQVGGAAAKALQGQGEELLNLRDEFRNYANQFADQARAATDTTVSKRLMATAGTLQQLDTAATELLNTQAKYAALKQMEPQAQQAISEAAKAGNLAAISQMFAELESKQRTATEGQKILVKSTQDLAPAAEESSRRTVDSLNAVSTAATKAEEKVGLLGRALQLINPFSSKNIAWTAFGEAPGAKTPGEALGGLIRGFSAGGIARQLKFYETGGTARGTDTIPAMLSEGEFVTTARNARRFLPQLQAINAGIPPAAEPASVTNNTTVGDIIVNGAKQPTVVAREVMRLIRREERRGSGRL